MWKARSSRSAARPEAGQALREALRVESLPPPFPVTLPEKPKGNHLADYAINMAHLAEAVFLARFRGIRELQAIKARKA